MGKFRHLVSISFSTCLAFSSKLMPLQDMTYKKFCIMPKTASNCHAGRYYLHSLKWSCLKCTQFQLTEFNQLFQRCRFNPAKLRWAPLRRSKPLPGNR